MGALHPGHASLMTQLGPAVDVLVASIFVNPLQFGEGEDLDTYPRTFEADLDLCGAHGVHAVFAPRSAEAMYPPGFSTQVAVTGLTKGLCGASRPGHFDGVTTVVGALVGAVALHPRHLRREGLPTARRAAAHGGGPGLAGDRVGGADRA